MKKSLLFILIFIGVIALALSFFISKEKPLSSSDQIPNDWFFLQRSYPTGKINHEVYVKSLKQANEMRKSSKKESSWEFEGPFNTGGRLSDVESHECDDEIFLGAASGGIFKVAADGSSWEAIFDDALSLSIGDIAIAPSDCEVMYVGTGEANCGGGSQTYDGVGIYKSLDGGSTWEHKGLEESRNIGRIVIHPENPDIAYAAAMGALFGDSPDRGIYKTSDGGDSWEQVLYVSDSTGGIDIVIHPDTPDILYAAMWERIRRPNRRNYGGPSCGIYKTTDGGENWTELTTGLPSPGEDVGRIGLDICDTDPDILYAIYADDIGYFEGVYKTQDGGDNWIQTNDGSLSNCFQSYGWWFGRIAVDPVDPNIAYVIGFDVHKTTNGGNSWSNISEWETHVDQHGLYIYPSDNDRVLLANDGGFYMSDDGGSNWDFINTLPITQFYTCEIDEQHPERLYGGTQDNGTNRTLTGSTDDWERIYGGDGFYVLVDPSNNNFVYAEYQYGGLGRSTNGGISFDGATSGISSNDRKNWNTPVVFDPNNSSILYYGSNKLYRSTNKAVSWSPISPDLTNGPGLNLTYGTLTTISVSPLNSDIIYTGTDDGNAWVTTDAGDNWQSINTGLPNRWVTRVAADPWEENTVYVTFSGYRWNEYIPHIFKSTDNGQNWIDISSNLPEVPINDIIIDPMDNQTLYIANDAGAFVSQNSGESWEVMGSNLPLVAVNDLDIHNETRKIVAATFGRSMYSYDLYQDTITGYAETTVPTAESSIQIYPNPAKVSSKITINVKESVQSQLYILDISGKKTGLVVNKRLDKGLNTISLAAFKIPERSKGMHILVVEINKQTISKKFVLEE